MKTKIFLIIFCLSIVLNSCGTISFNMSGASVAPAKTCQVLYFENRAEIVNPTLSTSLTNGLSDHIQANTTLILVNTNPDVLFEGEITGYNVQPQAVAADGVAAKDRLTVTIKVKFTNEVVPENSFEKSFSRYYEYASSVSFASIEATAIEEIQKELLDDIFNAAFSNW